LHVHNADFKCLKRQLPPAGIEPATNRLKVERST
jgi:hypothetical protein